MSTQFDRDDTIDSSDVIARIAELEEILSEEKLFQVRKRSTDEVLASFSDEEDADQFIEDEDYVPGRVYIYEADSEVDSDELEELKSFDSEGNSNWGYDWRSGMTVRRGDSIDENYAKNYASDRGDRFDYIDGYVDWGSFIDNYILEGEDSAALNGDDYYNV